MGQSNNAINNQSQFVYLNASQFQDLIYYFIINALAKENGMTVTGNYDHSGGFKTARETIQKQVDELCNLSNAALINGRQFTHKDNIDDTVNTLKGRVENGELRKIIADNVENKNESSGFWFQFLWSTLKRVSFIYSLFSLFACNKKLKAFETLKKEKVDKGKFLDRQKLESDYKSHLINAVLSIPNVLLLLSSIFGFGAIVNSILGLIILAALVYKLINQWPKQKQKFLIYKLLQSDCFKDIVKKNAYVLTPEVAEIYQYGEMAKQHITRTANQKLNSISNSIKVSTGYPEQYPDLPNLNPLSANFNK